MSSFAKATEYITWLLNESVVGVICQIIQALSYQSGLNQLENKDSSDNGAFTSHVKSNWKKWFTDDFKGGSPNIEDLYGNM